MGGPTVAIPKPVEQEEEEAKTNDSHTHTHTDTETHTHALGQTYGRPRQVRTLSKFLKTHSRLCCALITTHSEATLARGGRGVQDRHVGAVNFRHVVSKEHQKPAPRIKSHLKTHFLPAPAGTGGLTPAGPLLNRGATRPRSGRDCNCN